MIMQIHLTDLKMVLGGKTYSTDKIDDGIEVFRAIIELSESNLPLK